MSITRWLAAVAVCASLPVCAAKAQTYTTLYDFPGAAGAYPTGVIYSGGNLYGSTGEYNQLHFGIVYKFNPTTLVRSIEYTRTGPYDGFDTPNLLLNNALYGVARYGGSSTNCSGGGPGCGTVVKLDLATRTPTVIHTFAGTPDGLHPNTMIYANGMFYGTTNGGGTGCGGAGCGTIFAINPATNVETVLYSFGSVLNDGTGPLAGVIYQAGMLYGTTVYGGQWGRGTVYSFNLATGIEKVLHQFSPFGTPQDGYYPYAGVIYQAGTLYGTTNNGGFAGASCSEYNCGTVFAVNARTGAETVLWRFGAGSDGYYPAGLTWIGGLLYGSTRAGGTHGAGTLFSVDPSKGTESVVYSFSGPDYDTAVTAFGNNVFYGVTGAGTGTGCPSKTSPGCGTLFSLTP